MYYTFKTSQFTVIQEHNLRKPLRNQETSDEDNLPTPPEDLQDFELENLDELLEKVNEIASDLQKSN